MPCTLKSILAERARFELSVRMAGQLTKKADFTISSDWMLPSYSASTFVGSASVYGVLVAVDRSAVAHAGHPRSALLMRSAAFAGMVIVDTVASNVRQKGARKTLPF